MEKVTKIMDNVRQVVVGKDDVIAMLLTGILSGGHILIED
ncbi:MAG TPA: AAA family ATPase, partial [Firmicutes bacterium]|nr:AAA family ATPase [Bacillota bacterium]